MIRALFLLASLLPFEISVHWTATSTEMVSISVSDFGEQIQECLNKGREAGVRFEAKVCRTRVGWFDSCESPRVETRSVQYDPISESYKVVTDRHGDESEPLSIGIPNKEEALQSVTQVDQLALTFLARKNISDEDRAKRYLSIRVLFDCKGRVSKTFARISNVLTLGLVDIGPEDTGWTNFNLALPGNSKGQSE